MNKSSRHSSRRTVKWALIVFAVALVLRLVFIAEFRESPLYATPIMDMEYHHAWASAIAAQTEFVDGPFFRAPLYPIFLGAVYFVLGDDPMIIRIIQAMMGSLSALLVFLIGLRVFNFKTGLVAGLALAAYGPLIFYDGQLLVPTLAILLNLLAFLSLIRAWKSPTAFHFALGGLFLGLSAIARPTVLLFALAVFLWMLWRHFKGRSPATTFGHVVVYGAAVLIPILPVTVHNLAESGEFTLIGTYGGLNAYIGNNPSSDGVSAKLPGARRDWWGMMEDAERIAQQDCGRELSDAEQSTFWAKKAAATIAGNPGWFVTHLARKFILLAEGTELSNNFDLYFFAHRTYLLKLLMWRNLIAFPWGILLPLAVVGLLLCRSWTARSKTLALFLLCYVPAVILFFVTARYRLPMVPVLVLFAAHAVVTVAAEWKQLRPALKAAAVSAFVVMLVVCNTDVYAFAGESQAQGFYTLASICERQGDEGGGEKYYRMALAEDSTLAEANNNLGLILTGRGAFDEASRLLQRAVRLAPDNYIMRYNLAYAYLGSGTPEAAVPLLKSVLKQVPGYTDAANNLGVAYLHLNQHDSAASAYRHAVGENPDYADGYNSLGVVLSEMGDTDSAIVCFRRGLQSAPARADMHYRLGMLYVDRQATDSALVHLRSFLRYWRGDRQTAEEVQALVVSLES